ncbi:CPBP family intramembrane metalloprotease [Alkaliphilus sp. MSJ-5]|uniref:CPBP family intramembrane metalloprotease n=2 Tax=Alkaliphilus flagellatus TaxID=2841507 RepID=A0ABS6G5Z3_9FIRM|nr:CPBP family intramembrane metalloprotease [Alkaliphilus flagellatus]
MLNKKRLKVLDANLLYLIGAILFWTLGAYVQRRSLQSGLIITQYVIILLPPIIYIKAKKLNIKETLKLNKISFKHGFLVACITILTYPAAVFANTLLMTIMSLIGNLNIPQLPTATSSSEYLILMFVISISAGICEEVFFRGFILSGYERMGKKRAIILSAVLFGFFHFNLYNLMGPIVLGLVFGYLVVETNSIFAGMIGHIVNNGFAVTLGFILNLVSELLPEMDTASEAAVELPTSIAMLSSTIVFGVISAVTVLIAYQLVKIIKKDRVELNSKVCSEETKVEVKGVEFTPLIFTGILFIIIAIVQIKEIISLG